MKTFTGTLGALIAALEAADQTHVAPMGFGEGMSYRGYYDELAFEPKPNVTVAEMLASAKACLEATFTGYKGGEYTMHDVTDVWISRYGCCDGDAIGPTLLAYLTGASEAKYE